MVANRIFIDKILQNFTCLFKFVTLFQFKKIITMTEMKQFVPTDEAKGQAKRLRLFAILAWVIAIAGEIFAIMKLLHNDMLT